MHGTAILWFYALLSFTECMVYSDFRRVLVGFEASGLCELGRQTPLALHGCLKMNSSVLFIDSF